MPTLLLLLLLAFCAPVCRAQETSAVVGAGTAEKLGLRWELIGVQEHTAGGQKVVRVHQHLINVGGRSWWFLSRGAPGEPFLHRPQPDCRPVAGGSRRAAAG